MWNEGIEMAQTAYALDEAVRRGDTARVDELAELLSRQVRDEVSSQAEQGGWYEEYDRATSLGERVSKALRDPAHDRQLQRLRREAGWRLPDMAEALGIPLSQYQSYERGEHPIPPDIAQGIAKRLGASGPAVPDSRDYQAKETFCTIRWMRDDIVSAIERACDVKLDRNGTDAKEVESIIDYVIDEVSRGLQEQSTVVGWDIIDTLMPVDAIERAEAVVEREAARAEARTRTNVIKAVNEAGWKVHGNEAGDMFTLTHRNPHTDREFCVVLDMRGRDMADPQAWSEAAQLAIADDSVLWRGGLRKDEMNYVKADIDRFKAEVRRYLPDIIGHANDAPSAPSGDELVRDWYLRTFPDDELGVQIAPSLTFDDALTEIPSDNIYFDLSDGDFDIRERVFKELAVRYGLTYRDLYKSWLFNTPLPGHSLPDTVYGHDVSNESTSGKGTKGISLNGEAAASRQAADQIANAMKRNDVPVQDEEIR